MCGLWSAVADTPAPLDPCWTHPSSGEDVCWTLRSASLLSSHTKWVSVRASEWAWVVSGWAVSARASSQLLRAFLAHPRVFICVRSRGTNFLFLFMWGFALNFDMLFWELLYLAFYNNAYTQKWIHYFPPTFLEFLIIYRRHLQNSFLEHVIYY